MAVAVRVDGEPCRAGTFAVPSATFPGEVYHVVWQTEGLAFCGCPGHQHRGACKHVAAVALAIEVEARQAATPETRAEAAARLAHIAEVFSV